MTMYMRFAPFLPLLQKIRRNMARLCDLFVISTRKKEVSLFLKTVKPLLQYGKELDGFMCGILRRLIYGVLNHEIERFTAMY